MGMKYLFKIMKLEFLMQEWTKLAKALELPLEKMDIKAYPDFKTKSFLGYLEQDRKKIEANVRLVLVRTVGSCYVEEIALRELRTKVLESEDFKT
jgi:3-dehydroquinate synthetase